MSLVNHQLLMGGPYSRLIPWLFVLRAATLLLRLLPRSPDEGWFKATRSDDNADEGDEWLGRR